MGTWIISNFCLLLGKVSYISFGGQITNGFKVICDSVLICYHQMAGTLILRTCYSSYLRIKAKIISGMIIKLLKAIIARRGGTYL